MKAISQIWFKHNIFTRERLVMAQACSFANRNLRVRTVMLIENHTMNLNSLRLLKLLARGKWVCQKLRLEKKH